MAGVVSTLHLKSKARAMSMAAWNRNIHYHDLVLARIPVRCRCALDVGCGDGLLASRLADRCEQVVGIDADHPTLARARAAHTNANLTFVNGDVMTYEWPSATFDMITAIATLHHLPLERALTRFRDLLRPNGVLAVIGLYHQRTVADFAYSAAAVPATWWLRMLNPYEEVAAPIREPIETLAEIDAVVKQILPGALLKRELLFRYSLIWRKP
jgi:2-polyprenyl-3-methyl-5-hydroxy-6-metoxy-1,4-benzoquinol methylase